jgi:hypothetical protein
MKPEERSGREVGAARSTEEPREPDHEEHWGGKGSPNHGNLGGRDVRNVESWKHLNGTSKGSRIVQEKARDGLDHVGPPN